MGDSTTAFSGFVATHYHGELGSLLFEPYACELASRVAATGARRILETACGTGILTRRIAEAVPEARIVATDLNVGMLAVAREHLAGHAHRVACSVADMTALPFPDGSFDVVASQFGLMFAPDKPLAVRESRRVVCPGGALLLSTWAPIERNPIVRIAHETIVECFPDDPPRFDETPFCLCDPRELGALLGDAGCRDVRVETVTAIGEVRDARTAAAGARGRQPGCRRHPCPRSGDAAAGARQGRAPHHRGVRHRRPAGAPRSARRDRNRLGPHRAARQAPTRRGPRSASPPWGFADRAGPVPTAGGGV